MKTTLRAFALVLLLLLGLTGPVKSAVVVSDITKSEFDAFAANTAKVSWSITLFTGYNEGMFFPEVRVYRSDGTSVLLDHAWHRPEQILLSYDSAGKLSLNVGSTPAAIYPILGFDAVAFQIKDETLNGVTTLQGGLLNGNSFRNLFADDPTESHATYDQMLMSGFGSTFNYSGALELGTEGYVAGEDAYLKIIGFSIPEPSSGLLLFFGAAFFARRKR